MLDTSKIYTSNNYGEFKVINYVNSKEIYIEFIESKLRAKVNAQNIRSGEVAYCEYKDPSKIYKSNSYGDYKVIKYVSALEVYIEFIDTKTRKKTSVASIKGGNVYDKNLNQYLKNIYKKIAKPLDLSDHADITISNLNDTCIKMVSPQGDVYDIFDLKLFCKEYNLTAGIMKAISLGVVPVFEGWKAYKDPIK